MEGSCDAIKSSIVISEGSRKSGSQRSFASTVISSGQFWPRPRLPLTETEQREAHPIGQVVVPAHLVLVAAVHGPVAVQYYPGTRPPADEFDP